MTDTERVGRHRKASALDFRINRIVAEGAFASILGDGVLYVSLADTATGNRLGVDFDSAAIKRLRNALDQAAS